jgi:hypothetical protein
MENHVIFGHKSRAENGKIFVSQKDFQSPHHNDEDAKLIIEEINKIQNHLFNKIRIPELFSYNEISFWWFFHPQLYSVFEKTIHFIINFSKFLDEKNPSLVSIEKDFSRLKIIEQICKNKKIVLKYSKNEFSKYLLTKKIKSSLKHSALNLLTQRKIKNRRKIFTEKKKLMEIENRILFVSNSLYRRGIFNAKKNKTERGEYIFQNLIEFLKDDYKILGVDTWNQIRSNNKILSERINSEIDWIPLDIILEKSDNKAKNKFLKNFDQIINSKKFQELFKFQNLFIWNSLEETFRKFKYGPYLPYWIDLVHSLDIVFSKNKPKTIFLIYETGPISLAFINTCKKFQIKTIGIQHGLITKNHKYYSHNYLEADHDQLGFPLPDKFLVYGNITKKILSEKGYPEKKLIDYGNPVFFDLDKIQNYLENQPIHQKYDLKNDKKIILFTTAGMQKGFKENVKYDFDTQTWKVLLENFADNPNIQLVLKPHPSEDPKEYQKVLDNYPSSNAKIIQGNLVELLFISSLVISISSTTILDSLAMKTPVIQVKFENLISFPWEDYTSNGIHYSNTNDLTKDITKILEQEDYYKNLIDSGSKFIKDYYNIPEEKPDLVVKKLIENEL